MSIRSAVLTVGELCPAVLSLSKAYRLIIDNSQTSLSDDYPLKMKGWEYDYYRRNDIHLSLRYASSKVNCLLHTPVGACSECLVIESWQIQSSSTRLKIVCNPFEMIYDFRFDMTAQNFRTQNCFRQEITPIFSWRKWLWKPHFGTQIFSQCRSLHRVKINNFRERRMMPIEFDNEKGAPLPPEDAELLNAVA